MISAVRTIDRHTTTVGKCACWSSAYRLRVDEGRGDLAVSHNLSEDVVPPGTTSRRQLLKLGGSVGVAAWVIPAVQVISMSSAAADAASGGTTPPGGGTTPPGGGTTPPGGGTTPPGGGTTLPGGGVGPEVLPASYPATGVMGTQVSPQTLAHTGPGFGVDAAVAGAGAVALGIGAVVASRKQRPSDAGDAGS